MRKLEYEITKAQSKQTLIRRLRRNGELKYVVRIDTIKKATKNKLGIYKVVFVKRRGRK